MQTSLLVVDDDAAVRESLGKVFQSAGYSIRLAASAREGLDLLETQAFDLVLLDLHLPDRSGWDVFECLATRCPLLPVILITGLAGQQETAAAMAAGALLEKPLDAAVVLKTIERLLAEPSDTRLQRLSRYLEDTRRIPAIGAGYLERMPRYPISHFDQIRQFLLRPSGKDSVRLWRNHDQRP